MRDGNSCQQQRGVFSPLPERSSMSVEIPFGWRLLLVLVPTCCLLSACDGSQTTWDAEAVELRDLLRLPEHVQTPAIPEFNPLTAERIELGRFLFYDNMLSANEQQSCASCHFQALAFTDGKVKPEGSTGERLVRNSQALFNVAWNGSFTWSHNGFAEIEDQLNVPLRADNPIELGIVDGMLDEVVARFANSPLYQPMFLAAFPELQGEVTIDAIRFALAAFVRSLISYSSPYDAYLAGDRSALTDQQKRGLQLFNGERLECFHCHNGVNLTTSYRDEGTVDLKAAASFFNNGLYNVDGAGSYPERDQGLADITLDASDSGLFRPPSLRNVEVTAPYMHDGSIATLREVIEHYARGGTLTSEGPNAGDGRLSPLKNGLINGFSIEEDEIEAVIAFLESLTDEQFLNDPRFGSPFSATAQ